MGLRLGVVFTRFPVWNQTFCIADLAELERAGFEVVIYAMMGPKGSMQQPEVAHLRAPVHRVPWKTWSFWGAVCRMLATPSAWRLALRLLVASMPSPAELAKSLVLLPQAFYLACRMRHDGIAHVHAGFASYPATVAWMVSELTGLPFSFSAHAYDIYKVQTLLHEKIRRARFVHTCAEVNRQELRRLGGADSQQKIHVHRHGVDLQRFGMVEGAQATPRHTPWRLLASGNLVPYKGFEYLIGACDLLWQRGHRFFCSIIGEGPERERLAQLIQEAGLSTSIRFLAPMPQTQLAEQYRQADLFVLPCVVAKNGERDVIPNVLVEAMASGTPVISTYLPGIQELVQHGVNGFLVPCGDASALADAIATVMEDDGKRQHLRHAARHTVLEAYDRRKNAAELMHTFRRYVSAVGVGSADIGSS